MLYFMGLAFAVGLGMSFAVLGPGMGEGRAAAAALEGMARQPDMYGRLLTAMILALAFIESLAIFALVTFFILSGRLPSTADMLKTVQTGASATR